MKYVIGIVVAFIAMISVSSAQEYILFYGNGCPHCAKVEQYIKDNKIDQKFDIDMKEIYFNRTHLVDLQTYLTKLHLDTHHIWVPFLVINNQNECSYVNGSQPIIDFFQAKLDMIVALKDENVQCNTVNCAWLSCETQTLPAVSPVVQNILNNALPLHSGDVSSLDDQKISTWLSKNSSKRGFFVIMLPAALSDSINPCAFAVMLLLLTTILSRHKSRRKTLLAGWLFALAVFISYLAMGLGIFSALASSSNTFVLKLIVWVLGILVWLANIKDFFRYGKWFVMEVPMRWRPKMQDIIHRVSSPLWAFVVWLVVSVFLLPCSSWPYFTILWFLSSQSKELHSRWFFYLVVYNLIFVLPMIIIAVLVWFERASVDKIAKLKHQNTKLIHLIVGLLMLGLWAYVLLTI